MRVFVTGATGFIGSAVVRELIQAGHAVTGLSRSEEKAAELEAAGAQVRRGTIEDTAGLRTAASQAEGVIHLAFNHDFSRFAQSCDDDRRVIAALGEGLAGSGHPLVITSGTAILRTAPGAPAREHDPVVDANTFPRAATEEAATALERLGTNVSVVRLPQVHDTQRQGLITYLVEAARTAGSLALPGDGHNRWPAAHVSDVARLYRLALERAAPGARYHAVAEEGVPLRAIADTLGKRLGLPVLEIGSEEGRTRFGWMADLIRHDMPASSTWTRETLEWTPTGPGLLEDLARLGE
jgi:nucleoside-diphosphate-sugar epimerase